MEHGQGVKDERAFRLVACFKVWAQTNEREESVIVADVATAAAQGEVFLHAGHKVYYVDTVAIFINEGTSTGYLLGRKELMTIHQEVMPSQYIRADIYPGIKVHKYDREVLKRKRATATEILWMMMIWLPIVFGPLLVILKGVLIGVNGLSPGFGILILLIAMIACVWTLAGGWWIKFTLRQAEKLIGIPSVEEWNAK